MLFAALRDQAIQEFDKQVIGELLHDVEVGMNVAKLAKKCGSKEWNKYRPMRDLFVVIDDETPEKSEGGIWIPPSQRQGRWLYSVGTVVRVGPGKRHPKSGKLIPAPVEVGQRVTYLHHYGTRLETLEGNERYLRLLDQEQIAGIVEE